MPSPRSDLLVLIVASLASGCFEGKLNPPDDVEGADVASDIGSDAAPDAPGADAGDAPDAAPPDAADAGTSDAGDAPDATPPPCPLDRVLVTTSNFMMGGYALGRFAPTPSLAPSSAMALDQDHGPVQSGCVVYELLRGNDEIAVLDPMNLPTIARRISLRPTPAGDAGSYTSNPYDVYTYSPTKAYVVQYNLPRVAIIDPTRTGAEAVRGLVDLTPVRSPLDTDSSMAMEALGVVRAGRNLFVALQNLNAFSPVTEGTLAVIDPAADTLVDTDGATSAIDPVRLTGRNPVAMVVTPGGRLVVASAGVLAFMPPQRLDGGIEVIDPATFRSTGFRVTESNLGGDLSGFVMLDEARGWAVVSQLMAGGAMTARVQEFNLDGEGTRLGRVITSTTSISGIARDPSGNVWVLDNSPMAAGARVFNPAGVEITAAPISTGMYAPTGIAFVP